MRTQQVVVISGGVSSEHDVSVASGKDVVAALSDNPCYSVIEVYIDITGMWHVGGPGAQPSELDDVLDELDSTTVVFPVLHGGWGEGGGLQHELERRGIPFVGSGADAAALALSKVETLRVCASAGVQVIPTRTVDRRRYLADPDLMAAALRHVSDGPLVVKPDTGGSSIGVHIVPPDQLRSALDDVFTRDRVALVQPVITGQEVSVGVWEHLGTPRATPASLLHLPADSNSDGFTYAHKYGDAGAVLEIPFAFPPSLLAGLQNAALQCFTALGCRGLARVDFFITPDERILLNEINTIPGLRSTSHFPRLAAAGGTGYAQLLEALVDQVTPARLLT